jgi:hypothetical protein
VAVDRLGQDAVAVVEEEDDEQDGGGEDGELDAGADLWRVRWGEYCSGRGPSVRCGASWRRLG